FLLREMLLGNSASTRPVVLGGVVDPDAVDDLTADITLVADGVPLAGGHPPGRRRLPPRGRHAGRGAVAVPRPLDMRLRGGRGGRRRTRTAPVPADPPRPRQPRATP